MIAISKIKERFLFLIPKIELKSQFARSFLKGTGASALAFALLFLWMQINSDDTAQKMQELIPTKTAILELPQAEQALEPNTPAVKLSQERNINALPAAPIDGLSEEVEGKFLPIISKEGMTAFDAYKKPFTPVDSVPLVSIVVVDFGMSEKISQEMVNDLPSEISFVLNPYAADPTKWASSARGFGHEFWLSIPLQMKNLGDYNADPLMIFKNAVEQDNMATFKMLLESVVGYTGLVTTEGHDFQDSPDALMPLLNDIAQRGLGFVEINDAFQPNLLNKFMPLKQPYAQNNGWLDANLRPGGLESALKTMEQKAKRDGHIIVFTHPYPVVLKAITEWSKTLPDLGLQLAPLSAITTKAN